MDRKRKRKKQLKQFLLYQVAGIGGTLAEWFIFFELSQRVHISWEMATVFSMAIGLFVNWLIGRYLVFGKTKNPLHELAKVYAAGVVGLVLNMALMWLQVDVLGLNEMLAKVLASCLVFIWNFAIRKYVIYKSSSFA